MRLAEIGREDPWNAFAFTPHRFHELAAASGLEVVGRVVEFSEPTSFPHLEADHPEVTYYYAALRKPRENGSVKRRGRSDLETIVDPTTRTDIATEAAEIIDSAIRRR